MVSDCLVIAVIGFTCKFSVNFNGLIKYIYVVYWDIKFVRKASSNDSVYLLFCD